MGFDIVYNKEVLYKDYKTHDTKTLFRKIYRSKKFNDIIKDKLKTKGFNKLQFLTSIIANSLLDNDVEIGNDKTYDNYYKYIYDKSGGYDTNPPVCVVCRKNLSVWNGRMYSRLCESKECKDLYVKDKNVKIEAIHGTSNLAATPEHQKKMLSERGIAKEYTFKDGRSVRVMGKVEYAVVEELEELGYTFDDIKAPAPFTIKYYNPVEKKMCFHIPDLYISKYNLIISVKDGMDNPNTHPNMKKDRLKSIYEYTTIVDDTEYSFMQVEGLPEVPGLSKRLDKVKALHAKEGRYLVPPRVDLAMLVQESSFNGSIIGTPSDVLSNTTITFYALVEETTNAVMCFYFNICGSKYGNGYVIDLTSGDILFKAIDLTLVTLHSTTQLYKLDVELNNNVFDLIRMYDYTEGNEETLLDTIVDSIKYRANFNNNEYKLLKNLDGVMSIDMDFIQRLFNKKMSKVFLSKNMTMLLRNIHNLETKELIHKDMPVVCLMVEATEDRQPLLIFQIYDIYITIDMNTSELKVNPVREDYKEYLESIVDLNPKYILMAYDINRVKFMLYLLNKFISNSSTRIIKMNTLTRYHNSISSYLVEAITQVTSYSGRSDIIELEGYQDFILEWTLILTTLEDKVYNNPPGTSIYDAYKDDLAFLGYGNEDN